MIPADGPHKPLMQSRTHTPLPDHAAPGPLALNGAYPAPMLPLPAPTGYSSTPTAGALLIALKRRWLVAFTLAILTAIVAVAAVAYVIPPKYVAQARLELASRQARPLLTDRGEHDVDPSFFRANQQAIIKSPLVLSNALNSERLKGLSITGQSSDTLEKAIKVDFTQGPEIMTVKLSGDEPDNLADLLAAILQAYVKEIETRDNVRKAKTIASLQKSLEENEKTLAEKRFELRKAEKEQKIPDPVIQHAAYQALSSTLNGIQTQLRTVNIDQSKKKLDLTHSETRLKVIDAEPMSPTKIKALVDLDQVIISFATKIAAEEEQITTLKTGFPDSEVRNDKIQLCNDRISSLEESRKKQEESLRPKYEKKLRAELKEDLEHQVRTLTISIEALKMEAESLVKTLEGVQAELQALTPANQKAGVVVEKLRDDVKQIEKTQEKLAELAALQKAEPPASSRISILQAPETPTDRDYSRFTKMATGAGLGAFAFALFGVAFMEFRSRKISGVEEVTQSLGMTVVGTVPKLPASAQRPGPGGATARSIHWQSIITESVDAIRTQLLHAARTDAVQVVMVTSASGGEGKTSLASQLAASLARAWRKTLLVDGDLRNPAAHKLFNLPLEPGFSEVLRGEVGLSEVVKPTLLSRLWLIPAGHWDAHAIQALAQEGVRSTFELMKEQYDFIIVDSCPVLPVADSLLLGQHVDAVIFSVLRDVSRLPSVQAAHSKLQQLGVRMLGAVVIGAEGDPGSYVYRYTAQAGR